MALPIQTLVLILSVVISVATQNGPFDWLQTDNFDFMNRMSSKVTGSNCAKKTTSDLLLPPESVSMVPKSNQLLDVNTQIFKNRTCLLALHNLAMSRSYFVSYMFKAVNKTDNFWMQPGMLYYYLRQGSMVTAFKGCLNGSSIVFDYNMTYPNWIKNVGFNTTIPFFGPTIMRNVDRVKYPFSQKGPPLDFTFIKDRGVGLKQNYTHSPSVWYSTWLPDRAKTTDESKGSYTVGVKYSNKPGEWTTPGYESKTFFGPPLTRLQDNINLPVKFTQPYFDCGFKNTWLVSAVAPIVDAIPRYRKYDQILEFGETPSRFVGVVKMDTDWEALDFNPCELGEGNLGPNMFAGLARCKPTTMCQPLSGKGFSRGNYECVCRPGYRYPHWQEGPYQGLEIEAATSNEYEKGFNCIKIDNMRVVPSVINRDAPSVSGIERGKRESRLNDPLGRDSVRVSMETKAGGEGSSSTRKSKRTLKKSIKARYPIHFKSASREKRNVLDNESVQRMDQIFSHIDMVRQSPDCRALPPEQLVLSGDVGYGAKEQFKYQAMTALSMSHFLSNFLQNFDHYQSFGQIDLDKFPNPELLHGEALSTVMADNKIRGFGIWFDEDKYHEPTGRNGKYVKTRQYFAPYAFQQDDQYRSVDMAGEADIGGYLKTEWFKKAKMRWIVNTNGLKTYFSLPWYRSDGNGTMEIKSPDGTLRTKAPSYDIGQWTSPYFACNGYINDWIITYTVPFFARDRFDRDRVTFSGVVTVDIKLDFLDINQCPAAFYVPNAFKDTARCDFTTTYCVPVEGKRLSRGSYRCHCKRGFEYPFIENAWFYDGALLESEWAKKANGQFSKFDNLKCRRAGAPSVTSSFILLASFASLSLIRSYLY